MRYFDSPNYSQTQPLRHHEDGETRTFWKLWLNFSTRQESTYAHAHYLCLCFFCRVEKLHLYLSAWHVYYSVFSWVLAFTLDEDFCLTQLKSTVKGSDEANDVFFCVRMVYKNYFLKCLLLHVVNFISPYCWLWLIIIIKLLQIYVKFNVVMIFWSFFSVKNV